VHGEASIVSPTVVYGPDKYCVDDMIVVHNDTGELKEGTEEGEGPELVEFAFICVNNKVRRL
jgi:hypothetical protein